MNQPPNETTPQTPASDRQVDPRVLQHVQRCHELYDQKNLEAAEQEARAALAVDPQHPVPRFMLGVIYRDLERDEESETLFRDLLDQSDLTAKVHNNLGLLAKRRQDWTAAKEHFQTAIRTEFQFAPAHYNLGLTYLVEGQLRPGFREYEWRWYTEQFTRLKCLQPRWNGQPFEGTLLVHTEQGVGDTFQFCRYLPLIRARCRRLLLACSERMAGFFPAPEWADEIVFPGVEVTQSFEYYLPLLSAPHVLGTDLDSIPSDVPYLQPQPRTVDLGTPHVADARLRVGITWAGSPTHLMDHYRSCPLAAFAPVLSVPHVAFYSLQKGPGREQIASQYPALRDVDDLQADFHDTAAILKQLDLVISVDTAVVHLAGGLGLPAWCLLSSRCDWRWMLDREDSPWYPTVRLFRQSSLNDWESLMDRVASELAPMAATAG